MPIMHANAIAELIMRQAIPSLIDLKTTIKLKKLTNRVMINVIFTCLKSFSYFVNRIVVRYVKIYNNCNKTINILIKCLIIVIFHFIGRFIKQSRLVFV
jgi:hypothetical protein